MQSRVKEFASDYFAITGRPIATMTVEEYMMFYKMAKKEDETPKIREREYSFPKTEEAKGEMPKSVQPLKETYEMGLERQIEKIKKEREGKSDDKKVLKENKKAETKETSTNKDNMLAMLRSVSG